MSSTEQPPLPPGVDPDVGKAPSISIDDLMAKMIQRGARQALELFCEEAVAVGISVETVNEIIDRIVARKDELTKGAASLTGLMSEIIEGETKNGE